MREMDEDTINLAYTILKDKLKVYHSAARLAILAKAMLEKATLARLADGTITGKNEQLREASARELLPHLYLDFENAAENEREAKLKLDIARADVECTRALLRLLEIKAKMVGDE